MDRTNYKIVYCSKCGRQEYKNKMIHSMVDGKICRACANKEISKLNKNLMLKTFPDK